MSDFEKAVRYIMSDVGDGMSNSLKISRYDELIETLNNEETCTWYARRYEEENHA